MNHVGYFQQNSSHTDVRSIQHLGNFRTTQVIPMPTWNVHHLSDNERNTSRVLSSALWPLNRRKINIGLLGIGVVYLYARVNDFVSVLVGEDVT